MDSNGRDENQYLEKAFANCIRLLRLACTVAVGIELYFLPRQVLPYANQQILNLNYFGLHKPLHDWKPKFKYSQHFEMSYRIRRNTLYSVINLKIGYGDGFGEGHLLFF